MQEVCKKVNNVWNKFAQKKNFPTTRMSQGQAEIARVKKPIVFVIK